MGGWEPWGLLRILPLHMELPALPPAHGSSEMSEVQLHQALREGVPPPVLPSRRTQEVRRPRGASASLFT